MSPQNDTPVKVEYWPGGDGRWYMHVRHSNGRKSDANSYTNASNCRRAAREKYGADVQLVKLAKKPR